MASRTTTTLVLLVSAAAGAAAGSALLRAVRRGDPVPGTAYLTLPADVATVEAAWYARPGAHDAGPALFRRLPGGSTEVAVTLRDPAHDPRDVCRLKAVMETAQDD